MTTSSPGFHRFTWSPTFQTMPEASEPAMWNGSPCILNTLTGLPRAAQTPLKFTPAAITRTSASLGPMGGSSTSSMRMAVAGSPSRSGRMVQASIFSGSTPTSFGTSPSGSVVMGLLVGLDQLQQRAAESPGMEEGDLVPARAGPRDLVDERDPPLVQPGEQRVQVAHAQRQVVERVAAPLQELLQALVALRGDQLQRGAVGEVEESRVHLLRGHEFLVGDFLAEEIFDQGDRGVEVANADGSVVEGRAGNSGSGGRLRGLRGRGGGRG